jgi:predicted DNA-binding transcriptional regulator AlpA
LADGGKAPPGIKLGALRRWDLDELDEWIANGCPPVSRMGGQG